MELVDSRRLTGLNLHDARPGAIAQVRFATGEDVEATLRLWRQALERGLVAMEWSASIHVRRIADADGCPGAELMFTAEVDRLYAATELNEWAIARANSADVADGDDALSAVADSAREEQAGFGCALALIRRAEAEGLPCLIDDEFFSIGYGPLGRTWPLDALTKSEEELAIDWPALGTIPVALITGTNGKTTTSRLLARMAHLAGRVVGNTSTDGICVDEVEIEAGDWTGPGAARALLRRADLEVAILEAARGGLLRRGLEVQSCDAVLVTNVERDHMGEYGIHDLSDMAAVKGLVTRAVRAGGRIVLGADSPALVEWAEAQSFAARVDWVSHDSNHLRLAAHTKTGGTVWTEHEGSLVRRRGGKDTALLPVAEAPLTFGGKAKHNVANALSAAAVADALGLGDDAIIEGLRQFGSRPEDNPRAWTVLVASVRT